VIVGSVLTIIIIGVAIAIRIFVVTFVHNLRRNRHHGSKATAAGVTAQPSDVFKVCFAVMGGIYHFAPTIHHSPFTIPHSPAINPTIPHPSLAPTFLKGFRTINVRIIFS